MYVSALEWFPLASFSQVVALLPYSLLDIFQMVLVLTQYLALILALFRLVLCWPQHLPFFWTAILWTCVRPECLTLLNMCGACQKAGVIN